MTRDRVYRRDAPVRADHGVPTAPMLALCGAYACGLFLLLDALVVLARGHSEGAESTLYGLTFVLVLPTAVYAALARARSLKRVPGSIETCAIASLALAGAAVLVQRLLSHAPLSVSRVLLLATLAPLAALTAASPARLSRPMRPRVAGALLCASAGCGLLAAAPSSMFTGRLLGEAAAGAIALPALFYRVNRLRLRVPTWTGPAFDAAIAVLLLLLLADLAYGDPVFRMHAEYYVGAINDVLHGRTVLVDTGSQYGVGVIYALAAVFAVIPLRVGTFLLVISLATALQFAVAYAALRVARCSRLIAAGTVLVAVASTQSFSLPTPNTSPLRFGLPYVAVLFAAAATRWPGRAHRFWGAATVLLAIASLWSLETFAWTAATFVAGAAADAALRQTGFASLVRRLAVALAACVAAHVLFAIGTLAGSGHWPDWAWYLDLVGIFTTGGFGALPIPRWSPSFLLAGEYVMSAAAVITLLRRRNFNDSDGPALTAIAALAAFGAASFSYYVGRSHPIVLWDVAPPGMLLGGLWLQLAMTRQRAIGIASAAVAGAVAVLLVQMSVPQTPVLKRYSALAAVLGRSALPGSPLTQLRLAWRSAPVTPTVFEADQLIRRYAPNGTPTALLLPSQEQPEILLDTHRPNAIPIAYAAQDFLVKRSVRRIFAAARRLPAGTVVITSTTGWNQRVAPPVPALKSNPSPDFPVFAPLDGIGEAYQGRLLLLLRHQFVTKVLGSSPSGLIAVRLVSRQGAV